MYFTEKKINTYYVDNNAGISPNLNFDNEKFVIPKKPLTVGGVATSCRFVLNPMKFIKENYSSTPFELIEASKMKRLLFDHCYDVLSKHNRTNYLKMKGIQLMREKLGIIEVIEIK